MRASNLVRVILASVFVLLAGLSSSAQEYGQDKDSVHESLGRKEFSPYAGRSFPTRVLWGDTHLHTMISVDAGTMCRVGQEDAYRFARGEEITTTHGLRARLSRPLDFLVISDHAEMYGLMPNLLNGDPDILATEKGRRWYDMIKTGDRDKIFDRERPSLVRHDRDG
jgi:hypothetical protein